MMCDMCGKEAELYKTIIEGTEMDVCESCSKFGKVLHKIKTDEDYKAENKKKKPEQKFPEPKKEIVETIVEDYASIIKRKREELGMSQRDFAKKVAEKESIIHKIETGRMEPNIDMARKFERMLHIKLVESTEAEPDTAVRPKAREEMLTLGDMVKIKKRG